MVKIIRQGVYYTEGRLVKEAQAFMTSDKKEAARKNTLLSAILSRHRRGEGAEADALLLRDGADILRVADFIGTKKFALPVYLFGATDEARDVFQLSAAKKWGGCYLPEFLATPQAYALERIALPGQILLGNLPLPVGALGALGLEGDGGEALRAMTGEAIALPSAPTVAVFLKGKPKKGVGPTDVALAVLKAVQSDLFLEGKLLEVFGAGAASLTMDERNALDAALEATGCLSAVWATDERTRDYLALHGRGEVFRPLSPVQPAFYDGGLVVDLSSVEPMIWDEEISSVREYLAGCPRPPRIGGADVCYDAATYETQAVMAEILRGKKLGCESSCYVLSSSAAVKNAVVENGYWKVLSDAGVSYGEIDFPVEGIRVHDDFFSTAEHGSVLDARTIAASLASGGILTPATELLHGYRLKKYAFDPSAYESRGYSGLGAPQGGLLDYAAVEPFTALEPLEDRDVPFDRALVFPEESELTWDDLLFFRESGGVFALSGAFSDAAKANLIELGVLPLVVEKLPRGNWETIAVEHATEIVRSGGDRAIVKLKGKRSARDVVATIDLSEEERKAVLAGGKINGRKV